MVIFHFTRLSLLYYLRNYAGAARITPAFQPLYSNDPHPDYRMVSLILVFCTWFLFHNVRPFLVLPPNTDT